MKIDEVSKECDVPTATLRYWGKIGLLPLIKRDQSGYRVYEKRDLNCGFYVKALRKAGMDISRLKSFIDSYRASNSHAERKQILIDQHNALTDQVRNIHQTLNYLDYKIENFDSHMIGYEEEKLTFNRKEKE